MIRILLVEDSAVARELLVYVLDDDPELQVVGIARDGQEAVELAERLRPDLVLMDVHLPRLSGYEAARMIMERVPTPIVMVSASSSQTETHGAFQAISAGALVVESKPRGPGDPSHEESARHLRKTVKLMAEVKVVRRWPRREPPVAPSAILVAPKGTIGVVAIGASTGGPPALAEILGGLPGDFPCPILVVQHIAADFTHGLADWLDGITRLAVKVAEPAETTRPGTVYLAPDDAHLGISKNGNLSLTKQQTESGFRPSATELFRSVARSYGAAAIGVLLTGMGRDGAAGLLELRRAGGLTIAQDEESSAVFGMPKEAIRLGGAQYILPPAQISKTIRTLVGQQSA